MEPTVGRVVYYRDSNMSDQPCCALITYVHSGDSVNIVVFDELGGAHMKKSVLRGDAPMCWDWMPYQKQKAAAGDHNSESAEPRS